MDLKIKDWNLPSRYASASGELTSTVADFLRSRLVDELISMIENKFVTMFSDGFIPFEDNIQVATAQHVNRIIEPHGARKAEEIMCMASESGIDLVRIDTVPSSRTAQKVPGSE